MKKIEVVPEMIRVLRLEGQAILGCADRMKREEPSSQINKAVSFFQQALEKGGKIIVTGVGKSGKVGQKIAATLCSTGSLAIFLHPTEGLHGDIGVASSLDVILALSHTGNTDEILRLLPSFKRLEVPVVGMGGNASSQLAMQCDAWIETEVDQEACPH